MSLRPSKFNRRLALFAGLLSILATSAVFCPVYAGQDTAAAIVSAERGKALFTGAEPLTGRIREHPDDMPAAVVKCSNCHESHEHPAVSGSDAPVLSAKFLNERRSRRHGPESSYDERTFCRVMRTSIDPVYILLDHTMPAYELTDAQCQSLWRFLQEPEVIVTPASHSHS